MRQVQAKRATVPISIIIPTYNRPNVLRGTIKSYLSGRALPSEIIVVDQTPEVFNPACLGDLHGVVVDVIPDPIPSLTLARNIGAKAANNDVVLFSDDDILVDEDSLSKLADDMCNEAIALVAGVSLPNNGIYGNAQATSFFRDLAGALFGMKKPWRKDGYVVRSNMRGRYPMALTEAVSTEWAMGYFFCVRKSIMERSGIWFDEKLKRYAYAEDLDFSMRYCTAAKNEHLGCVIDPHIYVNHLASMEWRTPTDEAARFFVVNRRYLSKKLFPDRWWYRAALNWFDTLLALSMISHKRSYAKTLLKYVWSPGRADEEESCD